VSKHYSNSKPN